MSGPEPLRPSLRFRPENRLRRKGDIERVLRSGRRWQTPRLIVRAVRNHGETTQASAPRLALAVSRKVGNAIVRNRIRRRVREAFRLALPSLQPGWDVMVSAKPEAAGATYAQLSADLAEAFTKLGPWRAS